MSTYVAPLIRRRGRPLSAPPRHASPILTPNAPVTTQPDSAESLIVTTDDDDVSPPRLASAQELPTINGKRALRIPDVEHIYPALTSDALQRIPDSVLPRVRINRKNVMLLVEDLERFVAAHRSACAGIGERNV